MMLGTTDLNHVAFEDGTNIPKGTKVYWSNAITNNWYLPNESQPKTEWTLKWKKLRNRFESIISKYKPVEAILKENRIPGFSNSEFCDHSEKKQQELIQGGGGVSCEFATLVSSDGHQLFSKYPIKDAQGKLIQNSAGEAFAVRFGLTRMFTVYASPNYVNEARALPGPQLTELFVDASTLLFNLPASIAISVWKNWMHGFEQDVRDGYLWLDALFEIASRSVDLSAFYEKRKVTVNNASIILEGNGLFPRIPNSNFHPVLTAFPNEYGYPLRWNSKITDLARASVLAIDTILEQKENSITDIQKNNEVFISYSHEDKKFKDELLRHLKPLENNSIMTTWSDQMISPGQKFDPEIQHAIGRAKVAVLLLSSNYLASDYIQKKELAPIFGRAKNNELTIIWTQIRACNWEHHELSHSQAVVSPPGSPLANLKTARDNAWVKITSHIVDALRNEE